MMTAALAVAPAWRRWGGRTLLVVATLLAGCATSMSARVTSFQHWSDSYAGQTYQLVTPEASRGNLEYAAYQDMLRASLGATGLVEAAAGQDGRFKVDFDINIKPVTVITEEPVWWGMPAYGYRGRNFGYWGGPPDWVPRPVSAKEYRLTVVLRDGQNGDREVYRSTAEHLGGVESEAITVAPYLFQAVFDDFPGNNGQVRQVNYRID